ncbi:type II/IV secretion system protein [Stagnimonas aquatica]|uniref:Type II/IV secretion system protein n=1 Tax=Stagnimonas aquatica TaxID=2689987 RepID=A0A3N0V529_9GAMM|nr:GspE/PulE family protein [Stagnimonas aquatica]ROH87910.1 type II/IV secretion system protein [Stagnimonas aquatica]
MTAAVPLRLSLRYVLDALLADGWLTPAQVAKLLVRVPENTPLPPLAVIADAEFSHASEPQRKLTLEALGHWLAARSGLPYLRIDPLSIEVAKVTQLIPYAYAARAKILPLKVTPSEVVIAVADPYAREWQQELAPRLKQTIKPVLSSPRDIERYLVEFYALARSVKASASQQGRGGGLQNLEQLTELGKLGTLTADDQHIVGIVDWLLQYAFDQRASDIHLEPRREQGNVRFRIDGVLHEVYQVPAAVMPAVTSRLKILSRMDLAEKRKPQDGRLKIRSPDGREVELRVSSLPTAFGEKLVLRIFDPEVLVKDFAALGFGSSDEAKWRALIEQPHGIILVTGPTGSGKTTTLYSTLKLLASPEVNVCTIEDPIEMVEPSFNQMQVQANINLGFADGLRALLRQDPDIIMVGEIRDLDTAENAIQAALTGHLVLSTLHTNDAPSAIIRMLDLGVPPYLIKATVLGVMAQRLVRRLCPHCKRPATVSATDWQRLTGGLLPLPAPGSVQEPVGCLECRETGYLGRVGLYEILTIDETLRTAIDGSSDSLALQRQALKSGMVPLRLAGARKAMEGLTSLADVAALTPEIAGR